MHGHLGVLFRSIMTLPRDATSWQEAAFPCSQIIPGCGVCRRFKDPPKADIVTLRRDSAVSGIFLGVVVTALCVEETSCRRVAMQTC